MSKQISRRDFIKIAAAAPLLGAGLRLLEPSPAAQSTRPNVILIVFDTLAAKHMSVYGYPRQTTPNLRRFARRATVFHQHYAGGSFTSSGTSTLLTGAYPWSQRSINLMGTVTPEFQERNLFRVFKDAGYTSTAYTHNWMAVQLLNQFRGDINYWKPVRDLALSDNELSDRLFPNDHDVAYSTERVMTVPDTYGTGSLFLSVLNRNLRTTTEQGLNEKFKAQFPRGLPNSGQNTTFRIEDAMDWLMSYLPQVSQPHLTYFHLLPPHEPYNTRSDFAEVFEGEPPAEPPKPFHPLGTTFDEIAENLSRRRYDEFLAYADAEFGRLYTFMEQSGILDNSYVIFTSDHGQILERGTRGHTNPLLYQSITNIPLMISSPGQTERINVKTPTSAVDLLPTLAHIIGQPQPAWSEGRILPTFGTDRSSLTDVFTVDAKNNAKLAPLTLGTFSMVRDNYKLIHYRGYDKGYQNLSELYDLKTDPEELTNLIETKGSIAQDLQRELLAKIENANRIS